MKKSKIIILYIYNFSDLNIMKYFKYNSRIPGIFLIKKFFIIICKEVGFQLFIIF